LVQLLGQDGSNVMSFVDDVGKFQRGEALHIETEKVPEVVKTSQDTREEKKGLENYIESSATKRTNRTHECRKHKGRGGTNKNLIKTHKKPVNQSVLFTTSKQIPESSKIKDTPSSVKNKSGLDDKKVKAKPKTSQPAKGKASFICGCFGTVHKPLTNCLYCGRIACVKEGYDFCPFCGLMLEKVESKPPADETDKQAWLHKERLLSFDRQFARRTKIWDDQEDYYASSSSTWLSTEEQAAVGQKEEERNSEMHQRKKQTLELVL